MGIVRHESGVHMRGAAGGEATMWRGEGQASAVRAATQGRNEGVGTREQRRRVTAAGATGDEDDDGKAAGVVKAAMTGNRLGAAIMAVKTGSVLNQVGRGTGWGQDEWGYWVEANGVKGYRREEKGKGMEAGRRGAAHGRW